jgi:hypothetical protein
MARGRVLTIRSKSAFAEISGRLDAAGKVGAQMAAELLRARAVEEVPVESGALGDAITVTELNGMAAVVVDSVYGAAQHEGDFNHSAGGNGQAAGKSHYVSDPLRANRKTMYGIIAKQMRTALK